MQAALRSRIVLEQAKGALAQRGGLDMADAYTALRRYARDHDQRLSHVAQAVVAGTLPTQQLLEHDQPASATTPSP